MISGNITQSVDCTIRCSDLYDADYSGKTDPRAIIQVKDSVGFWKEVGRTENLQDNCNPTFTKVINVEYKFETKQLMRIVIEDEDTCSSDMVGETAAFDFGTIFSKPNTQLDLPILRNGKPSGRLSLIGRPKNADRESYVIDIRCTNVKDIEAWSKSDPFVRFGRFKPTSFHKNPVQTNNDDWEGGYQTEFKKDDLNPDFNQFTQTSGQFNNNNPNCPVKVEIWDHATDGSHSRIGIGYFTTKELEGGKKEVQTLDSNGKPSGNVVFQKFEVVRNYTITDYLRAGLSINLCFAVDLTSSNGQIQDPNSHHFQSPMNQNSYEKALDIASQILLPYDRDANVQMYGFGASFPMYGVNEPNHFFKMVGAIPNAPHNSPAIVLQTYNAAFQYAVPAEPTILAPTIKGFADWASSQKNIDKNFYAVTIILTDGAVSDMDDVLSNIIDASDDPVSFIILGIGKGPFTSMSVLDGDQKQLTDKKGRKPVRDIVQFVDINSCANDPRQIGEHLLCELPKQIVGYFAMIKHFPA